jgi:hypothetical protein
MTSKEPYTAAAGQARKVTEKATEAWKEGAGKFADQVNAMSQQLPQVDLNQPVEQYFEFVQRTVDLNRDLATRWAELVNSLTGATRERAESFSQIVKDQADTLAGMAAKQARKTEQAAQDLAEQAEQAEKEQARQARQAERAQAKQDRAKAREPYEDMTKAELSDQLTKRGLPKTGNVSDLIDRLVEADSSS